MTSLVVMIASGEIRAPENGCSEPSVTVTAPLVMHLPTLRLSARCENKEWDPRSGRWSSRRGFPWSPRERPQSSCLPALRTLLRSAEDDSMINVELVYAGARLGL